MPPQRRRSMTEDEQRDRRASIRRIMANPTLTPVERRKSIQSLMDGRHCSASGGDSMAAAAAAAAASFDSGSSLGDDDDDLDDLEDDLDDDGVREIGRDEFGDDQSVSSSISSGGGMGDGEYEDGGSMKSGSSSGRRFTRSIRNSFTQNFSNVTLSSRDSASTYSESERNDDDDDYDDISESDLAILGKRFGAGRGLGSAIGSSKKMESTRPPCNHYERKCTIVSPCCGLAFGCRICHDECPVLPPPLFLNDTLREGLEADGNDIINENDGRVDDGGLAAYDDSKMGDSESVGGGSDGEGRKTLKKKRKKKKKASRASSLPVAFREDDTNHNIDRFAIKEVICRECFTRQPSNTNNCIKCNVQFGEYHCQICNLWMSNKEQPYHCNDCGFCRVGGRENFRHCDDCGMCIDILLFSDHNCKTGKYMSNCPVCQEDLFSSRSASHEMPCGHAIHWHCFRELTSFDTRCPVCKKTAETKEQMAPTWNAMAMGIALQPVPADLARVVTIVCNDCEFKDVDRRWHFLGVQCVKCTSFNTTVVETQLVGKEAAQFLGDDVKNAMEGNHVNGTTSHGGLQENDDESVI